MQIALDMFGRDDVTTLGDIVQNIDEYDDEAFIYVSPLGAFEPSTPAAVVDEGSQRDWRIVEELGLIEHTEVYWAKEMLQSQRDARDGDELTIRDLVRSLEFV